MPRTLAALDPASDSFADDFEAATAEWKAFRKTMEEQLDVAEAAGSKWPARVEVRDMAGESLTALLNLLVSGCKN